MFKIELKKAIIDLLSDEDAIVLLSKSAKIIFEHVKNNTSVKNITDPFKNFNNNFSKLVYELNDLNKNLRDRNL